MKVHNQKYAQNTINVVTFWWPIYKYVVDPLLSKQNIVLEL